MTCLKMCVGSAKASWRGLSESESSTGTGWAQYGHVHRLWTCSELLTTLIIVFDFPTYYLNLVLGFDSEFKKAHVNSDATPLWTAMLCFVFLSGWGRLN